MSTGSRKQLLFHSRVAYLTTKYYSYVYISVGISCIEGEALKFKIKNYQSKTATCEPVIIGLYTEVAAL